MRARPTAVAPLAALVAGLLVAGCSAGAASTAPGVPAAQAAPDADPTAPAWLPSDEPSAGTVPESPLALPPAPTASPTAAPTAAAAAPAPPAPAGAALPCAGSAGTPVTGDVGGTTVTAVPVSCAGPDAVAVTAGGRTLGNALPAEEEADVHAVEVRDGHLVVTALAEHGPGEEDDVAVTSRWRVEGGQLVRTDRWLDPAYVLQIDAGHDDH